MTRKVVVTVADLYGLSEMPPSDLLGFKAWLDAVVLSIPPEFLATAELNIGAENDYEMPSPKLTVSYERPETPEEIEAREDKEHTAAQWQEWREREELARLAAKYGGIPC